MKITDVLIDAARAALRRKGLLVLIVPEHQSLPGSLVGVRDQALASSSTDTDLLRVALREAETTLNVAVVEAREAAALAYHALDDERDLDAAQAYVNACKRLREAEDAAGLR